MTNKISNSPLRQACRIKRMRPKSKLFISFFVFLIVTSLALGINSIAYAETLPSNAAPISVLDQIIGKSGLSSFAGKFHELSNVEPGADAITSIIFYIIDFAKYLLGAVAVIYIIVSGVKMILAGTKIDEVSEKQKENIKYIIYGLIFVIIADQLVSKVFFGEYGECMASASNAESCAKAGGSIFKGLANLILAILGSLSVFIIIISAFRLVTSYGEEETIKKEQKRIMMAVVGLLVAGLGEFVIQSIVFREGGTKGIDVAAAQKLVYNITNFISAFIGAGAFAMLFYGGYTYVVSAGNEEATGKAKKIIIGAIIGIVIAIAAFGIVATITTFSSGREINLPSSLPILSK